MIAAYILIKDFEVLYVGASRNVEARIASHRNKDYDYDYFVIIPTTDRRLWWLETMLISFLRPLLNKKQLYKMIRVESKYDHFAGFRFKRRFYIY